MGELTAKERAEITSTPKTGDVNHKGRVCTRDDDFYYPSDVSMQSDSSLPDYDWSNPQSRIFFPDESADSSLPDRSDCSKPQQGSVSTANASPAEVSEMKVSHDSNSYDWEDVQDNTDDEAEPALPPRHEVKADAKAEVWKMRRLVEVSHHRTQGDTTSRTLPIPTILGTEDRLSYFSI